MKKAKPHSLLFYLIIYSAVLFSIPIIISTIFYFQSENTTESIIENQTRDSLTKTQVIVDGLVREVHQIGLNLNTNPYVVNHDLNKSEYDAEAIYSAMLIGQAFANSSAINASIDMIFGYYHSPGLVVTANDNAYTLGEYLTAQNVADGEVALWENAVASDENYFTFLSLPIDGENRLVFMQNTPALQSASSTRPSDKIAIVLSKEFFDSIVTSNLSQDGYSCIVDNNNTILYESGNVDYAKFCTYNGATKTGDYTDTDTDGERYIVSHTSSSVIGWQYVTVTPTSVYLQPLKEIQTLVIAVAIIALLLEAVLYFVLYKTNYLPVIKIVSKISGHKTIEEGKNEFLKIEHAIDNYIQSAMDYEKKLCDKDSELHDNILHKMLSSNIIDGDNRIFDEIHNINYSDAKFLCTIIELKDWQAIFREKSRLCFALDNILNELGETLGIFKTIHYRDDCFAIIIKLSDDETPDSAITEYFSNLIIILREYLKMQGVVSAGNVYGSIKNISTSFAEALKTREFQKKYSLTEVLLYKNTMQMSDAYYYPFSVELDIISDLKENRLDKVCEAVDDILHKNTATNKLSADMYNCLVFDMIGTPVKILKELDIDSDKIIDEAYASLYYLFEKNDHILIAELLKDMYAKISEVIAVKKKENQSIKGENIKTYIEANFSDPNICLSKIADEFQINPSYLSTLFKDEFGLNIIEYIRKLKICEVKRLLKDTTLSIHAIAEKVGYTNSNVLIRNFKKETDLTPGQYREGVGENISGGS